MFSFAGGADEGVGRGANAENVCGVGVGAGVAFGFALPLSFVNFDEDGVKASTSFSFSFILGTSAFITTSDFMFSLELAAGPGSVGACDFEGFREART